MIVGTVTDGPYKGQKYTRSEKEHSLFAHWISCVLTDENGHLAVRDVPERFLDQP